MSLAAIKHELDRLSSFSLSLPSLPLRLRRTPRSHSPIHNSAVFPQLFHAERVIEGVFNGHKMVGPDGAEYRAAELCQQIQARRRRHHEAHDHAAWRVYLTNSANSRRRMVGELIQDTVGNQWSVVANGKTYKILTASATFYRGRVDEVIFLAPETGESAWGRSRTSSISHPCLDFSENLPARANT